MGRSARGSMPDMPVPLLVVGDLIFSSWSAKALAYADEFGFSHDTIHFPLDYPFRVSGNCAERIPDSEIVRDFCTGCRCEPSFFRRYVEAKLPFRVPVALHRVPILVYPSREAYFDVITIASSMYEAAMGASLVVAAGAAFSWFVHCQADYPHLIHDLSYSRSFRRADGSHPLTSGGQKEFDDLADICEYYVERKGTLSDAGRALFEIGIMNFAQASLHNRTLRFSRAVRDLFESCLDRRGPRRIIDEVERTYDVMRPTPASFAEIAAWYRKHPELPVIHDWQSDVFHYLQNDVAGDLFDHAARGLSDRDVVARVAAEYDESCDVIARDAQAFFALLNPNRLVREAFPVGRIPL